jgi:hypothetical protein
MTTPDSTYEWRRKGEHVNGRGRLRDNVFVQRYSAWSNMRRFTSMPTPRFRRPVRAEPRDYPVKSARRSDPTLCGRRRLSARPHVSGSTAKSFYLFSGRAHSYSRARLLSGCSDCERKRLRPSEGASIALSVQINVVNLRQAYSQHLRICRIVRLAGRLRRFLRHAAGRARSDLVDAHCVSAFAKRCQRRCPLFACLGQGQYLSVKYVCFMQD